jgi:hypothetical protein
MCTRLREQNDALARVEETKNMLPNMQRDEQSKERTSKQLQNI